MSLGGSMKHLFACLFALVGLTLTTGAAWAVSGGNYDPQQQDCPANASRHDAPPHTTVPGCHNAALNVTDGNGTRYAELGLDQLPSGYPGTPGLLSLGYPGAPNSPHAGCLAVNTNGTNGGPGVGCGTGSGTGFLLNFDTQNPARNSLVPATGTTDVGALVAAIASGMQLSFGADDNLDAGEHDGVSGNNGTSGAINGPSDGGAVSVGASPKDAEKAPTLTNPLTFLLAQGGLCADGICGQVTTRQQTVYKGCGANPDVPCSGAPTSRDVYNYDTKQWDPYNCSSGDATSEQKGPNGCGDQTMNQWRAKEASNVLAQPGIQIYEDPDPQGSPAGPVYPLPAVYVGTCGVALGGGPVNVPASPLTNSAHQLIISTGC